MSWNPIGAISGVSGTAVAQKELCALKCRYRSGISYRLQSKQSDNCCNHTKEQQIGNHDANQVRAKHRVSLRHEMPNSTPAVVVAAGPRSLQAG